MRFVRPEGCRAPEKHFSVHSGQPEKLLRTDAFRSPGRL